MNKQTKKVKREDDHQQLRYFYESDPQLDAFFDSFGIAATLSEEYKNFQKILSYNPSQLLRYQLNGIPLSIEPNQQFDCGIAKCGGKRRFEFQLFQQSFQFLDCENDKYTNGSSIVVVNLVILLLLWEERKGRVLVILTFQRVMLWIGRVFIFLHVRMIVILIFLKNALLNKIFHLPY